MVTSAGAPVVSPTRRRTSERRDQLVALATRGIFERGYEQFSINDLAAVAGLSVGGIYRYISTKSDLLVMACEDIYGGLHEELEQAISRTSDSEQQLRVSFELYLAACRASKDKILLLYREYRHLPAEAQQRYKDREARIAGLFADIIAAGQAAGEFWDADPRTVAQDMVVLGHLPALKGWALRDRSGKRVSSEQVRFVLAGLGASPQPPPRKRSI